MDSWQRDFHQGVTGKKTMLVNCAGITIPASVPLSVNLHLASRASDWWQLSVCDPLHLITPVGCHFCHSKSPSPSPGRSDRGAMLQLDLIHSVNNSCPVVSLENLCKGTRSGELPKTDIHYDWSVIIILHLYHLYVQISLNSHHTEGRSHSEVGVVRMKEDEKSHTGNVK